MAAPLPVVRLGEVAAVVHTGTSASAQQLAIEVRERAWSGVEDVVPAADSVTIVVDPAQASAVEVGRRAAALPLDAVTTTAPASRHRVEVCFDGPDLDRVAHETALERARVIELLERVQLRVGWLGFMPGFGYLEELPPPLASLGRLDLPRSRVEAGSFALGGGMAAVYPFATPGGWYVLGRTGFELFDPAVMPYATLAPGDLVEVVPVAEVVPAAPGPRQPFATDRSDRVVVVEPGWLTTLQDSGRLGVAHLGVPRAGPADFLRHRTANAAVGNPDGAPALEITVAGPVLRFECRSFVALCGDAPLAIDGQEMPDGVVLPVLPGNTVAVGRVRSGLRAYLGVAGGLFGPKYFDSYSADTVTPIPPGKLGGGDQLAVGSPGRVRGRFSIGEIRSTLELEVIPGPDLAATPALSAIAARTFEVAAESDRTGLRLQAAGRPMPVVAGLGRVPSRGMVTGAIQLFPNGQPVVLGPDHGTVGGYPVIGVLTRRSCSVAGQARPGDTVRFVVADGSDRAGSNAALADEPASGWFPREASSG